MFKRGEASDVIIYKNALLEGCFCGQMEDVKMLLDLVVQNGCDPDIILSYEIMIKRYCKTTNIQLLLMDCAKPIDSPLRASSSWRCELLELLQLSWDDSCIVFSLMFYS